MLAAAHPYMNLALKLISDSYARFDREELAGVAWEALNDADSKTRKPNGNGLLQVPKISREGKVIGVTIHHPGFAQTPGGRKARRWNASAPTRACLLGRRCGNGAKRTLRSGNSSKKRNACKPSRWWMKRYALPTTGSKDIGADGKPDWSAPQRDKFRAELRLKIAARLDSIWAETKTQVVQGNAEKPIEVKQITTDADRAAALLELLKSSGLGAKLIKGNSYEQRSLLPTSAGS
jgi:hypothetical protein